MKAACLHETFEKILIQYNEKNSEKAAFKELQVISKMLHQKSTFKNFVYLKKYSFFVSYSILYAGQHHHHALLQAIKQQKQLKQKEISSEEEDINTENVCFI